MRRSAFRSSSSSSPGSKIGTSPARSRSIRSGSDVANDDVVTELGEARAGHETDVTRAEDCHSAHGGEPTYLIDFSGFRPFAIASIVSFESESRSVFTTQ